jgi:hypothetical protein
MTTMMTDDERQELADLRASRSESRAAAAEERASRAITPTSKIQLGMTITLCVGMAGLAWAAATLKSDAMREIREQYVNKDLFNAKFDLIAVQLATQNEKLTDLKAEVTALRLTGEHR